MRRVHLLSIEDRFQIGPAVYLVPDFSVPRDKWADAAETVAVMRPDGSEFEVAARFHMAHFNIRDPAVPLDKRWRIIVSFPDRKKEDFPVGSRVLVSPEIRDTLLAKKTG
ncbi:hypothetical protein [Horticoccus sp. 23ND18S-11]|uniref:hypothetical protein n=1 Tax=Horticoccus sp. 23ND18S-11 TaxID=3391832 RepID=UPI0039C8FF68